MHCNIRILVALALSIGLAWAQNVSSSVKGVAVDESLAAVSRAACTLTNQATGQVATATSWADGGFTFPNVLAGKYTLKIRADGFKALTVEDIVVTASETRSLGNLVLQIGEVKESVRVNAEAAVVDSVSAQVSTNVSQSMVIDLPSATRNTLSYAELAPGVVIQNGASQVMNITGTTANVNGNRQFRNVFYLDGSDNTGPYRNSALQFPNPEAVAEVNVSTQNTSAEFGKQPGGAFNIITRSGTNQLHGSAFMYLHNEDLNANTWSRNLTGSPRPVDRLRQWGGTAGGPVIHNKTFFFESYMDYHTQAAGFQNTTKFPTDAMARGDFSQFKSQLYDPDTHQPLAGNIIPQRLLDPVAQNLMKLVPTVANYGDRYIWSFIDPTHNQELLSKVDHNFNQSHSLQLSYFHTWGHFDQAATSAGGNVPAFGPQMTENQQHTGIARHVWIVKPNVVLESKFATGRLDVHRVNANTGRDLSDFGAKWPLVQEGARKYLPQIIIGDGFSTRQGSLSQFNQNNIRFGSNLSWVRNKHHFKFGYELQRDDVFQRNDQDSTTLNFDGRAASTDSSGSRTGINVFGYSMADFYMGRVATFSTVGILDYNIHTWSTYFFAQDEWKVTPRLALTPGLRYELHLAPQEDHNRADAFIAGHQSDLYPNAPLGLAFAGDRGVPGGFAKRDHNNFAPRLGVAYDLTGNGKMVLRAGVGFYYSQNGFDPTLWPSEAPPWRPGANGGDTKNMVDIWGTSQAVVYAKPPTPFTTDVSNYVYGKLNNIVGLDYKYRTPYSLQWNLTLAKEITRYMTGSVAYVANRGFNNLQILPGNLPLPAPDASLSNIEARRPLQNYSNLGIIYPRARTWYDSLQLTSDIRSVHGLATRFTYVYGRMNDYWNEDPTSNSNIQTANPLNWNGEKAPDSNRHMFRAFYLYDLPALVRARRLVRGVAGGWQLSGSTYITSGNFLNVTLGQDYNFDSVPGDRPDLARPVTYTSGPRDQKAARYFDTASFANPASRIVFGTLPRNALIGPASWNSNLSLLKKFHFTEGTYLQLRVEGYNFLNHDSLNDPIVAMNSSDFGKILSRSGSRVIQAGARLVF